LTRTATWPGNCEPHPAETADHLVYFNPGDLEFPSA